MDAPVASASKDAHLFEEPSLPFPASLPRPALAAWARRAFLAGTGIALAAALVWVALVLGSRVFGLEPARANGTSMEPALHHGDALLLAKADPAALHAGEVVWALHEGWPIMHRIVDLHP